METIGNVWGEIHQHKQQKLGNSFFLGKMSYTQYTVPNCKSSWLFYIHRCIAKAIYLEKSERLTIWNGGNTSNLGN
jgi:hypothetical protein